jgi:hypothetical protein
LNNGIVEKRLLRLPALFSPHSAVNHDKRVSTSEQCRNLRFEIVERVAVLGKNHQLFTGYRFDQKTAKLTPLRILTAAAYVHCQSFEPGQCCYLRLQLLDRPGSSGLVENLFLDSLYLVIGSFFEILNVVGIKGRHAFSQSRDKGASLEQFELAQSFFKPLPAAAKGLIDGFRRRSQSPLKDGERKADGPGTFVILKRLRSVEFLTHVVGYLFIEPGFGIGKLVGHRMGHALGKQRSPVKLQQRLFDHATH